jgi:hypothetical protein
LEDRVEKQWKQIIIAQVRWGEPGAPVPFLSEVSLGFEVF